MKPLSKRIPSHTLCERGSMQEWLDHAARRKRARLVRQVICELSLMTAGAAIVLWLFAP